MKTRKRMLLLAAAVAAPLVYGLTGMGVREAHADYYAWWDGQRCGEWCDSTGRATCSCYIMTLPDQ